MSRRSLLRRLLCSGLPCAAALILGSAALASGPGLGHPFCTVNKRCQEKPPHWHIKRVCPKPVCDPCMLEHHGYYHTCWRPSSVPPDWGHCPVPPPAVMFLGSPNPPPVAAPPGILVPATPPPPAGRVLPEPGAAVRPTVTPPRALTQPPPLAPLPSAPKTALTPPPVRPDGYLPAGR